MSENIECPNLTKDLIKLKEKIDQDLPTKKNLWYVDVDLRKKYKLSFIEAGFLGMITQLQCSKEGYCRAKNYYFIDALGIRDSWIEESIKKLRDLKLVWVHYYMTKHGKRRQLVTPDSIRLYQQFLKTHKNWKVLKKFQEEFAIINPVSDDPEPPPPSRKKEPQPTEPLPPDIRSHSPSGISGDGPSGISGDAINTTYFPNKKNDVTCQDPRTADSDESCTAVFLSKLEQELGKAFSAKDAALGIAWYRGLTEERRKQMKKPIACIVRALKDGYAQQEVQSQNDQDAREIEKTWKIAENKKLAQEDREANYRFARHLIYKFSTLRGWVHRLGCERFSVRNTAIKSSRGSDGGTHALMPDGSIYYGTIAVSVDLDLPPQEFRETLKIFFDKCEWECPLEMEVTQ